MEAIVSAPSCQVEAKRIDDQEASEIAEAETN